MFFAALNIVVVHPLVAMPGMSFSRFFAPNVYNSKAAAFFIANLLLFYSLA